MDNRSVTMNIPSSPVPPTLQNLRESYNQEGHTEPLQAGATDDPASETPAPLTPGTLLFSPGVQETPPFSPGVTGTRDCNALEGAELNQLPEVGMLINDALSYMEHM